MRGGHDCSWGVDFTIDLRESRSVQIGHNWQTKLGYIRSWEQRRWKRKREKPGAKMPGASQKTEIDIAKMAGLYKEEKLGEGTQSRPWAGELG